MTRLPRPVYIAYRMAEMLISLFSRFLNAAFFGGSTYQHLSARCHVEQWRLRLWINALFFWQADHCKEAWEREIENARKTLRRAGVMHD